MSSTFCCTVPHAVPRTHRLPQHRRYQNCKLGANCGNRRIQNRVTAKVRRVLTLRPATLAMHTIPLNHAWVCVGYFLFSIFLSLRYVCRCALFIGYFYFVFSVLGTQHTLPEIVCPSMRILLGALHSICPARVSCPE